MPLLVESSLPQLEGPRWSETSTEGLRPTARRGPGARETSFPGRSLPQPAFRRLGVRARSAGAGSGDPETAHRRSVRRGTLLADGWANCGGAGGATGGAHRLGRGDFRIVLEFDGLLGVPPAGRSPPGAVKPLGLGEAVDDRGRGKRPNGFPGAWFFQFRASAEAGSGGGTDRLKHPGFVEVEREAEVADGQFRRRS